MTCHRGDVARRDHHDRMDADPRRAPTPSTTSPHAIPASHGTCHRPPGVAPRCMPVPSGLAPTATHRQALFWPLLTRPSSYSRAPALIHVPQLLFTHPGTYSCTLALIHAPRLLFTCPSSYSRTPALIHAPRLLFMHPGSYSRTPALIHTPRLLFTHPGSYSRAPTCSGPQQHVPTATTQDGPDASDTPQTLPTRPRRLRPCHLHGPTSLSPVSRLRLARSLHHATIMPAPDKSPPTRTIRPVQYSHTSAVCPVHAHVVSPRPCRRLALHLCYNPAAYPCLARLNAPHRQCPAWTHATPCMDRPHSMPMS